MTFSAPKRVSVLLGVGDDTLRAVIRDAHDRVVRDALGYVERMAAVTRRGRVACMRSPTMRWPPRRFSIARRVPATRNCALQVLVANLTLGADGHLSTPDGRRS